MCVNKKNKIKKEPRPPKIGALPRQSIALFLSRERGSSTSSQQLEGIPGPSFLFLRSPTLGDGRQSDDIATMTMQSFAPRLPCLRAVDFMPYRGQVKVHARRRGVTPER